MPRSIYLDDNAGAPTTSEVLRAMAECQAQGYANPASPHAAGRRARARLEDAREAIALGLGITLGTSDSPRLLLTSGGTESNNLALLGLARARAGQAAGRLILAEAEHPSVTGPARWLEQQGWRVERWPLSRSGLVRLDVLEDWLAAPTTLVALQLANHETGVVQPVAQAAALCAERGVPLFCDAVQGVGKLPVDFQALGVTALSLSGHKLGGPAGVGALALAAGAELVPLCFGGFQQQELRPGSESVTLAVGLATALAQSLADLPAEQARLAQLRARFESGATSLWPAALVQGGAAPRTAGTSCISFRGLDRQALWLALDLAGVCCATGSACASGSTEWSPTLRAMGCAEAELASALRFSLGRPTTAQEIDETLERLGAVCQKLAPPGANAARSAAPAGAVGG